MSTQNWIKMSERKPTEADVPAWLHDESGTAFGFGVKTIMADSWAMLRCWLHKATHWRPAAADIPAPPKEPTQAEKDHIAYVAWMGTAPQRGPLVAWHAALAYERAEVLRMLPQLYSHPEIEAVRARCGGAK